MAGENITDDPAGESCKESRGLSLISHARNSSSSSVIAKQDPAPWLNPTFGSRAGGTCRLFRLDPRGAERLARECLFGVKVPEWKVLQAK